jgi:hypothetical protein
VRGCQFSVNRFENTAGVLLDVIVPEAENRKALRPKEAVAPSIVLAFGVLRPVRLYDQASFETDEVDNVWIDDELTLELI